MDQVENLGLTTVHLVLPGFLLARGGVRESGGREVTTGRPGEI